MSFYGLQYSIFVLFLSLTIPGCGAAIDCALAHFDGSSSDSFRVYCAAGFRECGDLEQGCCPE